MTPVQKTEYVVQIVAAMVAHSGQPNGLETRIAEIVKLVEKIEAEVEKRTA